MHLTVCDSGQIEQTTCYLNITGGPESPSGFCLRGRARAEAFRKTKELSKQGHSR